jgi:Predicted metal-dependent hydrolase with the TIM-barrel fold
MQPAHLLTDIPLVERHWGARGRGAYAFESLRRRGTPMVFGSDVPVASLDPREGLYAALERRDGAGAPGGGWRPEERLGFDDAVRATRWARPMPREQARAPAVSRPAGMPTSSPGLRSGRRAGLRRRRSRGRARLTVVGGEVVMQQ